MEEEKEKLSVLVTKLRMYSWESDQGVLVVALSTWKIFDATMRTILTEK